MVFLNTYNCVNDVHFANTVQLTSNVASTSARLMLDPHSTQRTPRKSSNALQVLAFITPLYHFIKVADLLAT